jgi:NIPSNAP
MLMTVDCFFMPAFKSLQDRKEVREAAWSRPGWDECVTRTGVLFFQKEISSVDTNFCSANNICSTIFITIYIACMVQT